MKNALEVRGVFEYCDYIRHVARYVISLTLNGDEVVLNDNLTKEKVNISISFLQVNLFVLLKFLEFEKRFGPLEHSLKKVFLHVNSFPS